MRRTLIIIKPDAINRSLAGEILNKFEDKGLKIIGLKMERLNVYQLKDHYAHLENKPFFKELVEFMSSIPSILMVVEGKDAVNVVRRLVGATNGRDALPGTIRGDYSMSTQTNLVHASETKEMAEKEIKRFFKEDELYEYDKMNFNWVYCSAEKEKYEETDLEEKSYEEIVAAKKTAEKEKNEKK